jgi:hypothetical protein
MAVPWVSDRRCFGINKIFVDECIRFRRRKSSLLSDTITIVFGKRGPCDPGQGESWTATGVRYNAMFIAQQGQARPTRPFLPIHTISRRYCPIIANFTDSRYFYIAYGGSPGNSIFFCGGLLVPGVPAVLANGGKLDDGARLFVRTVGMKIILSSPWNIWGQSTP